MWRVLLLILTGFSVVSAAAGFAYLGPGGAQGWPRDFLETSPFDDYLWPGLAEVGCVFARLGLFDRGHSRAVMSRGATTQHVSAGQRP